MNDKRVLFWCLVLTLFLGCSQKQIEPAYAPENVQTENPVLESGPTDLTKLHKLQSQ